jgi:hypothetical protein
MDYINVSGGSAGGFDFSTYANSWVYILGAVAVVFVLMAFFILGRNR